MAFFGLSRVSRRLLKSSVSVTPSSSFAVLQSQHKSLSNPVTTHYTNPFTKCYPSWNDNYQVWSKGKELHQEKFLGVGWNYRLVGGMSSSSSVLEGKPKKDDKEKSDGVKEASWIDLYLPEEVRGYAKLARLDKPIGTWLLAWPCMW